MAFNFALFALYIFISSFTLPSVGARPWGVKLGSESRGAMLVSRSAFTTTTTVTDRCVVL